MPTTCPPRSAPSAAPSPAWSSSARARTTTRAASAGFARIVRETLAIAGPSRCVVWSTIVRPPYQGVSYSGYNRALEAIAPRHANLRVFDWAAMARAHPSWFGSDGVHPSMTGYRARAAATARLVRGCGA